MQGPGDRLPAPEEQKIRELGDIITRAISNPKRPEVWDKITAKLRELTNEHPDLDLKDFRLYNLLMGNTLRPDEAPASQWDIDGKIEAFIRELEK